MELYQSLQAELETYVAFIKRRGDIEQDYAEALLKLSYKQPDGKGKEEESKKLPPGGETTWRRAWQANVKSTCDEAFVHKKVAEEFRKILADLTEFRDVKDRIIRRVKGDVRAATTEHTSYLSDVGRLRKNYERKVDEVQAHEEAESAREDGGFPPGHWSDSDGGSGRGRSNSLGSAKGGGGDWDRESPPPLNSPPIIVPSATVFVSGATSTGEKSNAFRDAPSSGKGNVFDAIAKRDWSGEKKSLNSIVRAIKGESSGGQLKPSAVRGVKARQTSSKLKREAEQADRDYRNGIFRLETLRLQRLRLNRSASQSLQEFSGELSAKVKWALLTVCDIIVTAGDRRSHVRTSFAVLIHIGAEEFYFVKIGQDLYPKIKLVNPHADVDTFQTLVRSGPPEPKVYYVNAFVGECRTLLFGVSLNDYLATHPDRPVPLIVQRCIEQIDETGLDFEGIYRIPGKLATVQQLVHMIEKNEEAFDFNPNEEPTTVAGVLKLYLRQLPTPLFPWPAIDRINFSHNFGKTPEADLTNVAKRIRRLPPAHQATLKTLCSHLARVADHEVHNKMNATNLGVVFTPVVLGDDESATIESAMQSGKDIILELLIINHESLFDDSLHKRPLSRRASLVPLQSPPPVSELVLQPRRSTDQARPPSSLYHNYDPHYIHSPPIHSSPDPQEYIPYIPPAPSQPGSDPVETLHINVTPQSPPTLPRRPVPPYTPDTNSPVSPVASPPQLPPRAPAIDATSTATSPVDSPSSPARNPVMEDFPTSHSNNSFLDLYHGSAPPEILDSPSSPTSPSRRDPPLSAAEGRLIPHSTPPRRESSRPVTPSPRSVSGSSIPPQRDNESSAKSTPNEKRERSASDNMLLGDVGKENSERRERRTSSTPSTTSGM
ncbi:hypothetical protein P7C70_g7258, partial [Phenoliferia sp. Uapishka_3]